MTLSAAILLISFAFFHTKGVYDSYNDPVVKILYIQAMLIPFFPFVIGLYCLFISFKKVPTLVVKNGSTKFKLSLTDIIKQDHFSGLKLYLQGQLPEKVKLRDEL